MERPPRDIKNSKLTSTPLLIYSYLITGIMILCSCIASYAFVFKHYDISMNFLNFSDETYFKDDSPNIVTPSGHVYDASK